LRHWRDEGHAVTVPRLALSKREAARLLGIDRGKTLHALIRAGRLRTVPWGSGRRIPREDVERLAREGFELDFSAPRARRAPRARGGRCDPDALRRLDVDSL
jgi:excisionase family DNA binding protein